MVNERLSVLIVDDEPVVCDLLYEELSERGYSCATALDGNSALSKLMSQYFDVVLLDIKLPGMSGIELLEKIRSAHQNTAAIMVTAVNSVDTAVEVMKLGASDYIVKPFELDKVDTSIRTVSETKKLSVEGRGHKAPAGSDEKSNEFTREFSEINAIATGVEARYDLFRGYSKMVTQECIDIARQLGIPEEVIQKWTTSRAMLTSSRNRVIETSLAKLE